MSVEAFQIIGNHGRLFNNYSMLAAKKTSRQCITGFLWEECIVRTDQCNILTKRALVSQQSTLALATKDSHDWNLWIPSPTDIVPII